jgi:DNA-binding Xre family transcriptional regulator
MTGRIVNHLAEIKRQKEEATGKTIPWDQISKDLDIAYTTMLRWAKGHVDRYDDKILAKFCEYFGVQPGDILTYEE